MSRDIKEEKRLRGLILVPALTGGGVQKIMFDYVSRIHNDIDFEFAVFYPGPGVFAEKLDSMGIPYHFVTRFSKSFTRYKKELMDIYKNGQYDFVHDNGGHRCYFNLKYAKKCGIKTRIAHAHLCHIPENPIQFLIRILFTFLTKRVATDLYACSNETARWAWGKKDYKAGKVHIQNNAIQINQYMFNREKRDEIRKQMGIQDKFVIGHTGRFTYQKNHAFLIRAFDAYYKNVNHNAVLMLIGAGNLEDETKQLAADLGIQDNVLFLGMRNNPHDFLNAMDLFVFPSRYEGFGLALLEAVVNGLPCISNVDIGVDETNWLGTIRFVKKDDFEEWENALSNHGKRIDNLDIHRIIESGLDIDTNAEFQKKLYIETVKRNNG